MPSSRPSLATASGVPPALDTRSAFSVRSRAAPSAPVARPASITPPATRKPCGSGRGEPA